MQSDEVIWQIINHQFCSFKAKIARERTFCQNIYNVTGLCLRSACPLANSSYATIREIDGVCYLFIKTAERAHTPKKLWEKIRLPGNYTKALEIVSQQLEHFPKYLIHRNKQRLTKIHQMLIRMRKLQLKEGKPKIVTTSTRTDHREIIREKKALKAAQLDRAIENELLERLRQVSENEIYNYPEKQYTKALNRASDKIQDDEEEFEEEEVEEDSSLMMRQTNKRITASGLSSKDLKDEDDDEDEDDLEDGQWGNDINSDEDIDPMDGNLDVEYVEVFLKLLDCFPSLIIMYTLGF